MAQGDRRAGGELINSSRKKFSSIVEKFRKPKVTAPPDTKFVDLAPKELADGAGIYTDALNAAFVKDDVFNIALTGPYGSGKSSIIKTFLAQYKKPYLQLSLASFVPDSAQKDDTQPDGVQKGAAKKTRVTKQEIERSILQQILYGVDAHKLPFSRFKRIKAPKKISIATSMFILVGLVCGWYLFSKQDEIISGEFFEPVEWFNYFSVAVVSGLVWQAIHSIYNNRLGLALKSISLKNMEITPAAADEESILNRHLDEILYFFHSTKHELVVIEDLDRFDNPDIFVSLREINGLINANEGIKRQIRFLYALRDDMFASADRTKFFEFIVPVIPVINHSNSVDKLLEHSQRIGLDGLNKQFVREVSQHLDDLRLIQNILNEYVIYEEKLTSDEHERLDANKLLAILIYKNVMPSDFAALHRQEGVLATVLRRHGEFLAKAENNIRDEIATIKAQLASGDEQALRNQDDLRRVYAMAILERIPDGYQQLFIQDEVIKVGGLTEGGVLEALIQNNKKLTANTRPPNYSSNRKSVNLSDLETSVDPTRTFEQRKADLENRAIKFRRDAGKRISELESRLSSIRSRRFYEVVRESKALIDEVFAEVEQNTDLLKYLILEGHIDDSYYQYISLFHSVRMSPKDHSFLLKVRAYSTPPPDFPLDNVAEVIASMRPGDFGHAYVLNRSIVDHLFDDEAANAARIAAAVGFISTSFHACGEFFRTYYATGAHVDKLIKAVLKSPNLASIVIDDSDGPSHVARILAYASDEVLRQPSSKEALKEFLATNTDRVLAERVEFSLNLLRSLDVEIDQVEKLFEFPDALSFVAQQGLYRISIDNIACIVSHLSGQEKLQALETRHFSQLTEMNDTALLKRINSDFPTYVSEVLVALPANTAEDVSAIVEILSREDVEHDLRAEFLEKQTTILPHLNDIPAEFQQAALAGHHVKWTWENCLQFMNSEAFDADALTTYIQTDKAVSALTQQVMPRGEPALDLQRFVLNNDALADNIYRVYVRKIPNNFRSFPNVAPSKKKVLIDERKVTFNAENFQELDDLELQVHFVAINFDTYAAEKSEYPIDDEFRGKLLRASITDTQKLNVLADTEEAFVAGTPSVAAVVGLLLVRSSAAHVDYGAEFIKAVVLHSQDLQTKLILLNNMHHALSVTEIRDVLEAMPMPYKDIATYGKAPKFADNELNRQLARWLEDRKVISSVTETLLGGEIRINTFRKQPD